MDITATGTRLTTTAEPAAGAQVETIWDIDPAHSLVEFSVKHMMFTTVRGRFRKVRGEIRCPDESDPTRASVSAQIEAASIDTADEGRDAHLRGPDFLDVQRYPTITFDSTRIERSGAQDQYRVYGRLTIRDVTREIELNTTFNGRGRNPYGKTVAGFTAETSLNRRDFGITWNAALESGGLLVGDKVDVSIEVQAVKRE
jgi:polyisoprenoid-binding protein YceI